uniref:Adipose-secreted signaling protein n=1 Tax=Trichogramma kaykai TaxID=54128 RepID=A0ABD2XB81_9HYME
MQAPPRATAGASTTPTCVQWQQQSTTRQLCSLAAQQQQQKKQQQQRSRATVSHYKRVTHEIARQLSLCTLQQCERCRLQQYRRTAAATRPLERQPRLSTDQSQVRIFTRCNSYVIGYHVEFTVPWNTCVLQPEGGSHTEPAMISGETTNSNCRVIDFTRERDDLRLKVELFAQTERFLKEKFQIKCCEGGSPLTIYMNARVFGKGQGTPVLRNGIRCVGVENVTEEETEDDEDDDDNAAAAASSEVGATAAEIKSSSGGGGSSGKAT